MSRMRVIGAMTGAIISAFAVSGCEQPRYSLTGAAGAAIGGAAGGALGNQFGGGIMQTMFTAGGVILGGATGYAIGRRFEPSDKAMYGRTLSDALNGAGDGETRYWQNPETGLNGTIRPVRSYNRGENQMCRDYRSAVNFDIDVSTGAGTACRQPDGQWIPLAEAFG